MSQNTPSESSNLSSKMEEEIQNSIVEKYLTKESLVFDFKPSQINPSSLIKQDNYDERKIYSKYKSFPKDTQEKLAKAALHISLIGAGNHTFGKIIHDDETIEITYLFEMNSIKYNQKVGEDMLEDDLSARRLCRLLRYFIQEYIIEHGIYSYLWFKYSRKDQRYIPYCFPGSEYLVKEKDQAEYLFETYKKMDETLGTNFCKRLERIFLARSVYTSRDLVNQEND